MASDLIDLGRGNPSATSPSADELERAIRSVPGVAEVSVDRTPSTGRTRLRLRLRAGEDAGRVSWAVAATLRERFSIALDPEAIRPVIQDAPIPPPPPPAAMGRVPEGWVGEAEDTGPDDIDQVRQGDAATADDSAEPEEDPIRLVGEEPATEDDASVAEPRLSGDHRAVIRQLDTQRDEHDVRVTVSLEQAGRVVRGTALAVPTSRGVLRAVAEATVSALVELSNTRILVGIDRVEITSVGDPPTATVVLSLIADRGEETLLGVSLVRGDTEHAVMRATLDAVNRRFEPLLAANLAANVAS
jgi:copper chaperone CopZ